jgi:cellulose synthase/poly-beta-1,6-N-acetylglucosamine synthase-like glycosyltransferase
MTDLVGLVGLAALALLAYTWAGYPIVKRLRAARAGHRKARRVRRERRPVTIIVATREPPDVVRARVLDLRRSDYPAELLNVIIAVDAKAPFPFEEYRGAVDGLAAVLRGDEPGGKAAALNAAVRAATTDLLVFGDSGQVWAPDAVSHLVDALGDERFGAVTGSFVNESGDPLMDRYWRYEHSLRESQAAVHSIICVSGGMYAMRRALWKPLPAGLICDDLFVTMHVIRNGYRVGICGDAFAYDPRRFTGDQHFARKVRTLTGLLQLCAWMPGILVPWRNPIWVDFFFHKLMRIAAPYVFLLGVFGTGWWVLVRGGPAVRWAAAVCIVAGLAAVAAAVALRPALARSLVSASRLFLAPVLAARNALQGRWHVWSAHHRPPSHPVRGIREGSA